MRANTSLFGHIMGSSTEISGYYEMHIGYYSWKSLIKQKIIFHSSHAEEKSTKYYFDKVLHSEHELNETILNNKKCKYIFMLRSPERTIKSICTLYRRVDPKHEFSNVEGASKYYINRINDIGKIFESIHNVENCYYVDAESLINEPDDTLNSLSEWLDLSMPLIPKYRQFKNTGVEKFGDSSEEITKGYISKSKDNYADINVPEAILNECNTVYQAVRNRLSQQLENV